MNREEDVGRLAVSRSAGADSARTSAGEAETSTSRNAAARVGWALFLVAVTLAIFSVVLYLFNRQTSVPVSWAAAGGPRADFLSLLNALLQALQGVLAALLGALVIARRHDNRIGRLLLAIGLVASLVPLVNEITIYANFTLPVDHAVAYWFAWIQNWIWVVLYAPVLLLLALFPTGKFVSRRWTWVVGVPLLLFLTPMSLATTTEATMSSAYQLANPFFVIAGPGPYTAAIGIATPMMLLAALTAFAQMVKRYRAGSLIERQQIKWLVVGIVALLLMLAAGLPLALVWGLPVGAIMVNNAFMFPLLGMGIGMLRYRLYDVDLIINRALVYSSLTAFLLLVYFGGVVLLQTLFQTVTGRQSPLAIVISTLVIAALFTPVRRRLQDAIDRRFYRSRYDAAQTLARFARIARDEVDLNQLLAELTRVTADTLQPAHVSIWLKTKQGPEV